jgi:poly(hydroxyalkanoate) depolymerase family esterase
VSCRAKAALVSQYIKGGTLNMKLSIESNERYRFITLSVVLALFLLQLISVPRAASLKEITNFGSNPSNLKMFLYVPDNVKANPGILVGLHWCHGTADKYFSGNRYRILADQYGFIVIYPGCYRVDSCFDVHSPEALKHDGGSDPAGIVSMIKYVIKNNNGDSTRVFVTGHSGGGMMTNVMAGSYPEIFNAASGSATVPFACFAGSTSPDGWNDDCAKGRVTKTPEQWGDLVRAAYPGYTGPRPRIQLWHGASDSTLCPVNFDEAIEQWTNVLGVSQTPTSTETGQPLANYTRTRYTDNSGVVMVEAIKGLKQQHNITISEADVIKFFGLDKTVATINGGKYSRYAASARSSLTIEKSSSGVLHFTVSSLPGRIGIDLYSLNGAKVATIAEQYSATGHLNIVWDGGSTDRAMLPAGVGILSVKVNGSPVGECRTAFFMGK